MWWGADSTLERWHDEECTSMENWADNSESQVSPNEATISINSISICLFRFQCEKSYFPIETD